MIHPAWRNRARRRGYVHLRPEKPPAGPAPFTSDDEVLHAALQVFRAREALIQGESLDKDEEARLDKLRREERAWTRVFHTSFSRTHNDEVSLCDRASRSRLNRLEREIFIVLVQSQIGLGQEIRTGRELLEALGLPGDKTVAALRSVSENSRLYRAGLVSYEDLYEDVRDRQLVVDPMVVEAVLQRSGGHAGGWTVKTEADLHNRLGVLTRALFRKSDDLGNILRGYGSTGAFYKSRRRVMRLLDGFYETLRLHRSWKIAQLMKAPNALPPDHRVILLALLGKEVGHLEADSFLFKGAGLAKAAAQDADDVRECLCILRSNGILASQGLIRPCGGMGEVLSDDPKALEETEFELTEKATEALGLEKSRLKRRSGKFGLREPRVRLDQLVLSEEVTRALRMALAHARNAKTLVDTWGFGEVLAYGRGVTLLFAGPPGTGKTACAEALAHELGKPIIVANYAEIQNCFVGVTEKNIARTFREAKASEAVLFWDEADAMFYDRGSAHRNWEVRDVNVLLQELERFEGVCVLATNRKISLDKALERRITMKVQFERPDRGARRDIWRKMLPKKLPLAKDVDVERLAEAELSGGEIKNVILNAARMALERNGKGPVTMEDLTKAVEMEIQGAWSESASGSMGFRRG